MIVAIERYAFLPPIPGAVANGRDWFTYLTRSRQVPVERVRFLIDTEATDYAISRAVTEASALAASGGRVWFVFIGHGAPSTKGEGLLVAVDAHQSVEGLEHRSVPQRKVLAQLAASAATPVAIVDACFSGRQSDGSGLIAGLQPSTVVKTNTPERSVLLTAAASNQYAGPLPGDSRPAFSYLVLGALRGWGDVDQDGAVTGQEAVDYSRSVLLTLLAGSRTQTPEALGQRSLPLARASERGPDLGSLLLDLESPPAAPALPGTRRTAHSSVPRPLESEPKAAPAAPRPGAGHASSTSARVSCGYDSQVSNAWQLALFTVEAPPTAEVYIDGEPCGHPPLRRMFTPGLHRMVIRTDKGVVKRYTLALEAGKHEQVRIQFGE